MITNWFKRLAVSAVVEDINSNGRILDALKGCKFRISSVSDGYDGYTSITADRIGMRSPL